MAKGVKDGCGPWLWSSKHLGRVWRLEHFAAGSGSLLGKEEVLHPCHLMYSQGFDPPCQDPSLKSGGFYTWLHTATSWQCQGCISAAQRSLFRSQVPTTPSSPHPRCPGNPRSSGSPSLATDSSGGEAELDWQEAPGASNDNVSTHLSVIKSCV